MVCSNFAFCGEIHDAAKSGDLEKVKALLNDNPDLISSRDENAATPLHAAALMGHKDVAELLLANKADVNAKNNYGITPLEVSAIFGHKDVAELLLNNKAEVFIRDNYGNTALDMALSRGFTNIAELFRQHGNSSLSEKDAIEAVIYQINEATAKWTNSMIELKKDPIKAGFSHGVGDTVQKYHDDLVAIDISGCPDDFRMAFVEYYQAVGGMKTYFDSITGWNGVLKGIVDCVGTLIRLHDNTDKALEPFVEAGNGFELVCTKYHVNIK